MPWLADARKETKMPKLHLLPSLATDNWQLATYSLPLLQILLNQRRLLPEERNVLLGGFQEIGEHFGSRGEGLHELALLLVAPGGFEAGQLAVQTRHERLQLLV